MKNLRSKKVKNHSLSRNLAADFLALSHRILLLATSGLPRIDFVREISKMLIQFSGCDAVELRLKRRQKYYRCEWDRDSHPSFHFEYLPCLQTDKGLMIPCSPEDSPVEKLCRDIILHQFDPSSPFFTPTGSFWLNGSTDSTPGERKTKSKSPAYDVLLSGGFQSLAVFPLIIDEDNIGTLLLKNKRRKYFTQDEILLYEGLAQTLGVALVHRHAQVALRERIKELTCLYRIAQLSVRPGISLTEIMQGVVESLPPAWLFPEIASARIILDGQPYTTAGYRTGGQMQTADITVNGQKRGSLEVVYAEEKPKLDEGPFLKEERNLIDNVAREVANIIERKQMEEEKSILQDQLMHADRLATIGQLAAGVAHELNEPLSNILGFSQLIKKCPGLPDQAQQDIEKTIIASLHAREIVKKLMLFARRMPPHKIQVNLNQLVEEGLYFLESRCTKEGIELVQALSPDLPEIIADPAQLTQVLVNLTVNAVQAMPQGGKLTVSTYVKEGYISLVVEDNGTGMSEEVKKNIFIPFFTTKDVHQGTGLGLPVVHGIVSSHGGSIKVESQLGSGSRFEVKLPLTGAPDVEENE
jgi:signal transduction histidine kinase